MHLPSPEGSDRTGLSVRLATFNIRYGKPDRTTLDDSLIQVAKRNPLQRPAKYYDHMHERPWSERRLPLVEELLWNNVTLVCMSVRVFTSSAEQLR